MTGEWIRKATSEAATGSYPNLTGPCQALCVRHRPRGTGSPLWISERERLTGEWILNATAALVLRTSLRVESHPHGAQPGDSACHWTGADPCG